MKLKSIERMEWKEVEDASARGVRIKILLGEDEGVPNFIMRAFEVAPGGNTPRHSHNFEHEVFVLSGRGIAFASEKENEIGVGDTIYIAPNEEHQFRNPFSEPLRFICLIPKAKA